MLDELVPDLAGDGNEPWKPRENPLVGGVVAETLARRMSRPAVNRRQRADSRHAPEEPGEQIGLVVVRVHDIDLALPDEVAELEPDGRIERVPFENFDVVDRGVLRALRDAKRLVASIAQIAHRDVKTAIGEGRAEQDGLFGTAARAAHASQFKNANRS